MNREIWLFVFLSKNLLSSCSKEAYTLSQRKRGAFDNSHRVWSEGAGRSSAGHYEHDGDNESVKSEGFGEDHHEDESNEDILLTIGTDARVTDDSDGETGGKG